MSRSGNLCCKRELTASINTMLEAILLGKWHVIVVGFLCLLFTLGYYTHAITDIVDTTVDVCISGVLVYTSVPKALTLLHSRLEYCISASR